MATIVILSKRWFAIYALGAGLLVLSSAFSAFRIITIAYILILIATTLVEFYRVPSPDKLQITRNVDQTLSVGSDHAITISLKNLSHSQCYAEIKEDQVDGISTDWRDYSGVISASHKISLEYSIRPTRRGDFELLPVNVRIFGPLRLIGRTFSFPIPNSIKVVPNVKDAAKLELLSRKGLLQQAGYRTKRQMGSGRDFESLREYQPDDEFKKIDWKASARVGKLIARQYEVEKSQNVIVLLDVGRTMLAEIDGLTKLDYALNAIVSLAYAANLNDDRIGLLIFSDTVHKWIPPNKGSAQVSRILQALYNVEGKKVEADYKAALAYLGAHWRRRSLVIDFTDLWDASSSRAHIIELSCLQPRHLVACVTLLDTNVTNQLEHPIDDVNDLFDRSVALEVIHSRNLATGELSKRGVIVVDSPANEISLALVNRYLHIKSRSLI